MVNGQTRRPENKCFTLQEGGVSETLRWTGQLHGESKAAPVLAEQEGWGASGEGEQVG